MFAFSKNFFVEPCGKAGRMRCHTRVAHLRCERSSRKGFKRLIAASRAGGERFAKAANLPLQ
ncbi:hypothetical protein AS29_000060 [Bacillus sp. SJS]|nr:hypothetical protein AS29_000060 [Bacillus sp. SJS]